MGNWFTKEIDIVQQKTQVRAGSTFEKLCTLQVSPDASWLGSSQINLPSVECIGFDETDTYNGLEWTRNADGALEMTICVRANKAGTRSAQLKFTPQVRIKELNRYVDEYGVPFTVKIPASSHCSGLTKETIDIINGSPNFEAGAQVVFELELYDIWNNTLAYADSDTSTKIHGELKSKTDENEQNVSEGRLTDQTCEVHNPQSKSNLCQIKFVPRVAGKHELYITIGGEPVQFSPLSFNVLPSRIHSLCAEVASQKSRVRSEEIILKATAFDQSKNVVSLNNQLHTLEISCLSSEEAKITLLPLTTKDDKRLCRGVIFHRAGKHSVRVSLHKTSDSIMVATHVVIVNVTLPPIFLTQSTPPCASPMATKAEELMLYGDEPFFTNSKTFLTLKLNKALAGETSEINKTLVQNAMRMTIDGQKMEMQKLQVHSGTVKFEISGIREAGERLLKLLLHGKCISELWLNVVGIQDLPKDSLRNKFGDGKRFELWCNGFKRCTITGADCSHINNINRACSIRAGKQREISAKVLDATAVEETNGTVKINLSKLGKDEATAKVVRELVCLALKGDHFRRQAREFDTERRKWQRRAQEAYDKGQGDKASFSRRTKEMYGKLMSKANDKASESIFGFYNYGRNQQEIDLHELLVADEEELDKYRVQLQNDCRYKSDDEIDRLIREKCYEDNEAIRMLQHRLESLENGAWSNHYTWLEILVGTGYHSRSQRQKMRPEVEKFLIQKHLKYRIINKGSLLVTFGEYSGPQPCVATFYCKPCNRTWTNAPAWVGTPQYCKNHPKVPCSPFKLRPCDSCNLSKSHTEREKNKEEHRKLCKKCQDDGVYCGDSSDSRYTTRRPKVQQ